ncbi:hypothetical protein [Neptunomonas phycophila]|uniref:hypothetical protein n=1 Tax=Neptunomonas phycophila TaxID=1572645 RepID=UPI0015C1486B|nr:hypothetical protein [Neptunomonas phycophila]QLE99344.1 hypothetical protein FLM49_17885 [Neptunomonas phycophila]
MVRLAKLVAVGLVGIGVVELALRGNDAALYAWYLLFVLWLVVLLIRFLMAAVDAYKTVFAKGPNGEMTFPEFEKKMASFGRGSGRGENGPSSTTTSGTGSRDDTGDPFYDFGVNPILRKYDPFGEFFDS